MGNVFSIQCSDTFIGRCWDCTAQQPLYDSNFRDNLKALETARDELIESRNDVMLTVNNQRIPEMVQAEATISQVTDLIERGKEEGEQLGIAGLGSKNCKSSYILGESLAQCLKQVAALKDVSANFKGVVIHELANRLRCDIETLKIAREQLLASKEDVKRRIALEPEQRPLIQVQLWFSMVETTIAEADELIRDGPQEVGRFFHGGNSNHTFVGRVTNKLGAMVTLMSQAEFDEVVGRAPSQPDYKCELQDNLRDLKSKREDFNEMVGREPSGQDYVWELQDDLKDLKRKTIKLWALKEDVVKIMLEAEGQQMKPLQQVQLWLSNVEAVIMEVDKLVEEAAREMEKLHLGDFYNKMFVRNVGRLLNDAVVLIANGDFKYVLERTFPKQPVVGRLHDPTVGTQAILKDSWSSLIRGYNGFIGIVGVGGVGKTTLLTLINKKFANTPNDFDVVISVVVSKDWKLEKIQEDIWKQIGFCDEKWLRKSFSEKVQDILRVMKKKKFVLLLDDVWEQFNLERIGVPLPQNGSKVVIASRSIAVSRGMTAEKIITVEPLNTEDAWHLFHKHIGDIDADALPLAREVAKECFGLPIALIAVGSLMASRRSSEEWRHALIVLRLTSNLESFKGEVYPLLKFSYDCLHNNIIQSCFLYFSLLPYSFKILKTDLVHYWMCQRFCCIDEGYVIVNTLVRRGLLEEEGNYVKMHDLIRDVALSIACKCGKEERNFFVQAGSQSTEAQVSTEWEGAVTVSLMANSFENFHAMGDCCDVLSVFLSHNPLLQSISKVSFLSMDKLTILDLSKTGVEELPLGVSGLRCLLYLNLSHTRIRELPRVLILLRKLEYLNLDHTAHIQMIPSQLLSNLSELQILKMFQCGSMTYHYVQNNLLANGNLLIQELLCLQNLVELSITIRSSHDFNNFCREPRLLNCTQGLVLQACKTKRYLNISSLANAKHLNSLLMFGNINVEELIVEVTEPRAASGLTNNQLIYSSLEEVIVSNYNGMRELTWLILVPNLTILRVTFNDYMEEMINPAKFGELQHGDGSSNLFPKLRFFELRGLPKLKSIYWKALSFPCLEQIDVYNCPKLKKLPLNSSSATGWKVVIRGEESWCQNLEWEDDATQAAFSSCVQKI